MTAQRKRNEVVPRALPGTDGGLSRAVRYRDILASVIHDQGGAQFFSETRMQLARRFATCAVAAEQMEAQLTRGESVNVNTYTLLCRTLLRIANAIGTNHIERQPAATVSDYLHSSRTEQRQ